MAFQVDHLPDLATCTPAEGSEGVTSVATTASTTPEKVPVPSLPSSGSEARAKLSYLFAPRVSATSSTSARAADQDTEQTRQHADDVDSCIATVGSPLEANLEGRMLTEDDEISALRAENARLRAQVAENERAPAVLGIRGRQCGGCCAANPVYSRAFVGDKRLYCEDCWGRWERSGRWWPSMRVCTSPPVVGASGFPEFSGEDAFVLPGFICAHDDLSLLNELRENLPTGKDFSDWHGARHLGMHFADGDTAALRMDSAPSALRKTFARLEAAFGIRASAARLNLYRSSSDFKPLHADRGRDENGVPQVTVGLSLGATRELSFAHYQTGLTTTFPQQNGDVFAFTPELNKVFLHGVPRVRAEAMAGHDDGPRMSLILWGSRIVVERAMQAAKAGKSGLDPTGLM